MRLVYHRLFVVLVCLVWASCTVGARAEPFELTLRWHAESKPESGLYFPQWRQERWEPAKTAVIVCDMWDSHHCYNAVQRVKDMAPRMNEFLKQAREQGSLIIHAPSSCMKPYEGHPARLRAQSAPQAGNLPEDISKWCHRIPAEEKGEYPIDQSDGGEDDDPEVHRKWHQELAAKGLKPGSPWTRQIDVLEIDDDDAITDSGVETWNLLEDRKINNVIMVGVHTNMCVLGRPFGLRQMSKNGKNVVLVRDLTDTMYNPAMKPYVNHHTGTDLIVEHIEKFVCPTIASSDLLDSKPHRFFDDARPRVAVLVSEFEYETFKTLPAFCHTHLGKDFKVDYVLNEDEDQHAFANLALLKSADVLVLSAWRRALPKKQLDAVARYVKSGRPVVAIRTASHAFMTRDGKAPKGHALWADFDRQVLGGHYRGHRGNHVDRGDPATVVWMPEEARQHALLKGVAPHEFKVTSWLYKMRPLAKGATPLMYGRVGGTPVEPVSWVFRNEWDGDVFYTSLGHPQDFEIPAFTRLLKNAVYWAARENLPKKIRGNAE